MIPCLIVLLIVGILLSEPFESFLAKRQIVQFVLEYHSGVEQSVLYYIVAFGLLLIRKRNLCKIILAGMGVRRNTVASFHILPRSHIGRNLAAIHAD